MPDISGEPSSAAASPSPRSPPGAKVLAAPSGALPPWAWAAACAVMTFLVFLPAVGHAFLMTWDDGHFVVDNEVIRQIDAGTLRAMLIAETVHYWAPLTWLSLALDYRVWGSSPLGFHLTNVLLHALNAALVFLLARRLLALPSIGLVGRPGSWAAALAALAWSLHPLRVEAVAWIVERKSVLGLAFGLGSLLAWVGHAGQPLPAWRSRRYALALALYLLALASKPVLVTLPVVLLILDAFPLRRPRGGLTRAALAEKLPFFAAAGAVTAIFIRTSHHVLTYSMEDVGLASRLLAGLRSVFDYTRFEVWPAGLSPFYLHVGRITAGDLAFLVPALLVAGLTVALALRARRHPAMAAAWLAWLAALLPGIMSSQVSDTAMADRFTYFASLPITLWAAAVLVRRATGLAGGAARLAVGAAVVAAMAMLTALTVRQLAVWRDDVALWSRPIELEPTRSGRVYAQRAGAREQQGDLAGAVADMGMAIEIAAAKRYARIDVLYRQRAQLRVRAGELEEAVRDYGSALQTPGSLVRLDCHRERAALYRLMGRPDLAIIDDRLADELLSGQ